MANIKIWNEARAAPVRRLEIGSRGARIYYSRRDAKSARVAAH
jgi:hypothetical protein